MYRILNTDLQLRDFSSLKVYRTDVWSIVVGTETIRNLLELLQRCNVTPDTGTYFWSSGGG